MRYESARSSWFKWGSIFVLAATLGAFQMALLSETAIPAWTFASEFLREVLGTLLYLLLPALASFLAARQSGDASSGLVSGCLVSGVGFLILVVVFALVTMISPGCYPGLGEDCGDGFGGEFVAGIGGTMMTLLLVEGVGGVIGSLVGGWFGGSLGERWATRSHERSRSAAPGAPSGEARGQ
jgi:hypothetical protein